MHLAYFFVTALVCSRAVANLQLGHKPRLLLELCSNPFVLYLYGAQSILQKPDFVHKTLTLKNAHCLVLYVHYDYHIPWRTVL